jgi:hypothetical protein
LYDVNSWYVDGPETALKFEELNADSSDGEIRAAAESASKEAIDQNMIIPVEDVVVYLTAARGEARDKIRCELEDAAEQVAAATQRRNELIRRVAAFGDSTRSIGQLANLSHTGVAKIVGRSPEC